MSNVRTENVTVDPADELVNPVICVSESLIVVEYNKLYLPTRVNGDPLYERLIIYSPSVVATTDVRRQLWIPDSWQALGRVTPLNCRMSTQAELYKNG